MNAAVSETGTFDIALKLLVALDLTFTFAAATFLAHHLAALLSKQHITTITSMKTALHFDISEQHGNVVASRILVLCSSLY